MTNVKVSVIRKARYGVLFLPVLWLLFSLWVVVNEVSEGFSPPTIQEAATPLTTSEIINMVYPSFMTIWVFVKILHAIKNHSVISSELKSGFSLFLGMTITHSFHLAPFLSYVGIALTDIAAIIMMVTLFQGKPFGETTLYHKDIQLRRV